MTCFSQTGCKIEFDSLPPHQPGVYWFCEPDDFIVGLAYVGFEDDALCAAPVGCGALIRKANFLDFLWAPASRQDGDNFRAYTRRLTEVSWNEPVESWMGK